MIKHSNGSGDLIHFKADQLQGHCKATLQEMSIGPCATQTTLPISALYLSNFLNILLYTSV